MNIYSVKDLLVELSNFPSDDKDLVLWITSSNNRVYEKTIKSIVIENNFLKDENGELFPFINILSTKDNGKRYTIKQLKTILIAFSENTLIYVDNCCIDEVHDSYSDKNNKECYAIEINK